MSNENRLADERDMPEQTLAVVPYTGEMLELRGMTDEQLAVAADDLKEFERTSLRDFKEALSTELHTRMDSSLSWTLKVPGGWTVTGTSPDAHTEYEERELRDAIQKLAAEGLVPVGAIEQVFIPKKGYDISKSGLNKLMKLGAEVKSRVEACKHPKRTPRWVRVSRDLS